MNRNYLGSSWKENQTQQQQTITKGKRGFNGPVLLITGALIGLFAMYLYFDPYTKSLIDRKILSSLTLEKNSYNADFKEIQEREEYANEDK